MEPYPIALGSLVFRLELFKAWLLAAPYSSPSILNSTLNDDSFYDHHRVGAVVRPKDFFWGPDAVHYTAEAWA